MPPYPLFFLCLCALHEFLWSCILGDSVNSEDNKERYNKENKAPERRTKELDGYVGFANLPNQVYRKAVKKGFDFTLMVVGESCILIFDCSLPFVIPDYVTLSIYYM